MTLIELMITLTVLGVLAAVSVPSYRSFLINQQLSSASSDFLGTLLQARSEAIRLGQPVAVFPTDGSNWSSGWYITVVNNSCTAVGAPYGSNAALGDSVTINSSNTNKSFAGSNPSFVYAASGFPLTSCASPLYSGAMNGSIAFQASATGRERRVVVSNSGRARICDPSRDTATPPCSGT